MLLIELGRARKVNADSQYSVEMIDPFRVVYREGNKSITFSGEMTGGLSIGITARNVKNWDPPFQELVVDEFKLNVIVYRIRDSLKEKGFSLEIWW